MKPYQYIVLRCVPRVQREEFVNVGIVLYCQADDFLAASWQVDEERLRALDPQVDLDQVCAALAYVDQVCRGTADPAASPGAADGPAARPPGTRFGFLKAPRSTVLQPGPVHGGVTADPARQLDHLLPEMVG